MFSLVKPNGKQNPAIIKTPVNKIFTASEPSDVPYLHGCNKHADIILKG